ncbi:NADH-quinone oxidoreductase subunit N [Actinopolyspora alba]|uniref:NADH-quinone oxidoreductase subunit N n=1 Tax=Actinopolyspora alba TaxID=673379 RepID=A0A1I2AFT5_9ACTN|nr:NADH-quinone oxidoreductase subunit N [Actinopolyspora alba]SFE42732.1 NADH-quinone oxidoreductase subunit N [Actinopolyspora alba]
MNAKLTALVPELALAAGAVLGLLAGSWLPRAKQWSVGVLTALACVVGLVATASSWGGVPETVFGGSYALDVTTHTSRLLVLSGTVLVIWLAGESLGNHPRKAEFYVLSLLAALGTIVLAGATDLLLLAAGYLLASIPLYALAGFSKDAPGTEASLKYYLLGALLGVTMLTGVTLLYGVGRTTRYVVLVRTLSEAPHSIVAAGTVLLLAGLLFKIGAVPTHFWVPDVTEGAAAPVAAFVTTVPKVGGLVAVYRLVSEVVPPTVNWPSLIAVLASASMTLGNLAAFFQESVRRLLAYSTISQVGYIMLAVTVATRSELALPALLFYTGGYVVTNIAAFAVISEFPGATRIADYRGMARSHPALAGVLVLSLLGLVGTPPTAVFLGKLEVFSAAVDGGYTWLAVLAVVNTVISLFYYLRWMVPALLAVPGGEHVPLVRAGRWTAACAYTAACGSLGLGLGGGLVLPGLTGTVLP